MTIEYLIKQGDMFSHSQLFQAVSPQRFAVHTDLLAEKWKEWQDTTAGWTLPILMQTAPETAASLLDDFCKNREKLFDSYRIWEKLMENFTLLPENRQKSIAFAIIEAYRETYGDKVMEVDEAIEKYQKAIEKNPKDAEKYIGLGNI